MKKKIKLILGILVLLALVAGVFGYLMLGSIVKSGVEQVGPMVTKVPVKVGGATVSILSGSGSLRGFVLGNPEGFKTEHAMKMGKVGVSISPGSVLKEKVVVRSVRVEGPEIIFEQGMKGNNLSQILENVKSVVGTSPAAPCMLPGCCAGSRFDRREISERVLWLRSKNGGGRGGGSEAKGAPVRARQRLRNLDALDPFTSQRREITGRS